MIIHLRLRVTICYEINKRNNLLHNHAKPEKFLLMYLSDTHNSHSTRYIIIL